MTAAENREPVTLEVKYELGHSYRETWNATDLYCPSCGAKKVWVESGAGDYYEGPGHLCVECGADFTMPRLGLGNSWQDKQRREAILGAE